MAAGAHPSPATGSTSDGRCVPDDGMRQSTGLTLPAVLGWCSVSVRRRGTLVHGLRRDPPQRPLYNLHVDEATPRRLYCPGRPPMFSGAVPL